MALQEDREKLFELSRLGEEKRLLKTFENAFNISYTCDHSNGHPVQVKYLWFFTKTMWFCRDEMIYIKHKPKI